MDPLVRAIALFVFCIIVFRFSGKRTLKDITVFDFVLLLIISEAAQNALIDDDYSLVNGMLVIGAYVLLDIGLSLVKRLSPTVEKMIDGTAVILVEEGKLLEKVMRKSRVDKEDILQSAREQDGIENLQDIKYAILEKNGTISIIPYKK
ncbi:MAG: DUF421 domain-containing protein [Sphingobacteriales bacterium]|nr:MAG: DUF421 domain-containing protein [Sphingobacteriales bacterium]